jgi:hypothetical protein
MERLKKYTTFEALKFDEKSSDNNQHKDIIFSEFEAFLKQLRSEYSNKKKTKTGNGKQPNL